MIDLVYKSKFAGEAAMPEEPKRNTVVLSRKSEAAMDAQRKEDK